MRDESLIEMVNRGEVPPDGWGGDLLQSVSINSGVPVDDIDWFAVTDETDIQRLDDRLEWELVWTSGTISGLDFTVDDGVKFGLKAVWVGGKQPDNNDGIVYLRNGQSVVVKFEVWNLVNGVPESLATQLGNQGDIPILVDGIGRRLHIDLTAGVSESWTLTHETTIGRQAEYILPQKGYKNTRYKTFGDSVIVRHSTEPSEI
ncbi:MAG: hypothetical protein GY926_19400 [bacterium]|nr:hypothetical protein [bacterium]